MKFLHSMIRVNDVDRTLEFYCDFLGLKLLRKKDYPKGKYSLYFLATDNGMPEIELTHNWGNHSYSSGDNFGHLAYLVEDIYAVCNRLKSNNIPILRPPRDGHMAFVKDPNGISIELLQSGQALPAKEPWLSMSNIGTW